jgi:hypothetical protein
MDPAVNAVADASKLGPVARRIFWDSFYEALTVTALCGLDVGLPQEPT